MECSRLVFSRPLLVWILIVTHGMAPMNVLTEETSLRDFRSFGSTRLLLRNCSIDTTTPSGFALPGSQTTVAGPGRGLVGGAGARHPGRVRPVCGY
jgi:hypothetical protein